MEHNVTEAYRLSPQQKRLWLQSRDGSRAFYAQCALTLDGPLRADELRRAAARYVSRHQILSTRFECLPGMKIPVLVVGDDARHVWREVEAEGAGVLTELCELEARAVQEPPGDAHARFCLLRLSGERHVLIVTLAALRADRRTLLNLCEELARAYRGEAEADEPVAYVQFSEWQHELLSDEEGEEGRDFWRQQARASAAVALPAERDRAGAPAHAFAPAARTAELPAELSTAVRSLAARRESSPAAVLSSAWQTLLRRLSGQADISVRMWSDGRVYEEMDGAAGLYERWLPVNTHFEDDYSFVEVLERADAAASRAREWQEYWSAESSADAAHEGGDAASWPVGFDYVEWGHPQTAGGVKFTLSRLDCCTERFKLRLSCAATDERITLTLHYDSALYEADAVERLLEELTTLLAAVAKAPRAPVSRAEIVGPEERRMLLREWNSTAGEFRADATLHQLLREQAARNPDAVALLAPGRRLSFAELDRRSDRLAHLLRARGVGAESRVALLLERSPAQLVAVLAAWKAGAAYVPLDPAQPAPRLAFMLEDSRASLVLCSSTLRATLPESAPPALLLDEDGEPEALDEESHGAGHFDSGTTADNLAYVIYTSGSTGRPKGALVTHRSVSNLLAALRRLLYSELGPGLTVSLNAPLSFDSSVKQLAQLLDGHALCLVPEEVRPDGDALLSYLDEMGVEVFDCTPSQLRLLLAAGLGSGRAPRGLRAVLLGGEAVDAATWEEVSRVEGVRFFNLYGPTECTVDATGCEVVAGAAPHLGSPVRNVEVYVVDGRGELVPAGVEGELWIGGEGVCRGYTSGGARTAERFVPDAFSGRAGARLYRTGDVVRRAAGGRLEFVGRRDGQVKVRGSRVELGEVEAALRGHAGVRDCAAALYQCEGQEPRLVGYVVAEDGATLTAGELRAHLQGHLPEYMIPSAFVPLEALPLTRNGKLDRGALPAPEQTRPAGETAGEGPRTPAEEVLCGVWGHLLGVERVGVNDNFFELGGHSLLATQVITRVRKTFDVEVPLRALFESPTVAALAAQVEAARRGARGSGAAQLTRRREGASDLPLSFAQQRLWFVQQLEPESTAYNIPRAFRLQGRLDVQALRQTLSEVVRRHEVLRTTFPVVNGTAVQRVAAPAPCQVEVVDLSGLDAEAREAEARRRAAAEGQLPFDLARGPLLRATLLRLAEGEHVLLLTMHHIVFDAWSIDVLLKEVGQLYPGFAEGRAARLAEPQLQYGDFAAWQREWLQGETLEGLLAYWRRKLDGAAKLELPTDRPRPLVQTYNGATRSLTLPRELSERLQALSRREGVTMYMTLLAAFKVLLHRYSGQGDISVGTPVANRNRGEIEDLIGFFINTLVLRTSLEGGLSFRELLGRVRETALGAYEHQEMPFEHLVEALQPQRDMSRPPLFQVMFALLQNAPLESLELPGLALSPFRVAGTTSKFDLLLMASQSDAGLTATLEYNTDLFDDATAERMLSHLSNLLEGVAEDADRPLVKLPLMSEAERRRLLVGWNQTAHDFAQDRFVHQLFEAQAARTPDAPAVVFGETQLSYGEINRHANRLAHYLRGLGVGPEKLVGIFVERSVEMVVSVLGVLKAGGAYLPLDPTYPSERLAFMIEDARARVLLTKGRHVEKLPAHEARVVCLDEEREAVGRLPADDLPCRLTPDSLVYVTYTSGSTGRPKGIAMVQRPLLNLLQWQFRNTHLPGGARTLQFASLSFDVSFQDMFSTWGMGGTVVLIDEAARQDISGLARVLAAQKIERLFIPAVALQQLAEGVSGLDEGEALALRKVIAGSEQLQVTQPIARMFARPGLSLHNEYGPSEAHVVTSLDLPADVSRWPERPSIGRPISNVRIYIHDSELQPVPPGVIGELYIGGVPLARGYLGRPATTAERFIPDPHSAEPGARLYRTGDLARYLADGNIEFLGRADHQVKIRGYRIEPGEVEAVLAEHPAVRETVVVVREDVPGDKRLVAYVVAGEEHLPNVSELRDHARRRLPDYMVPAAFVRLEQLPLNSNGKVDRRALPAPDRARPELAQEFVAPRSATEEVLASVWAEVLGREQVGVHDNFFDLGGHSLLATQLVSRVRGIFSAELPLRHLFESPTVAGLAERLTRDAPTPEAVEGIARLFRRLESLSEEEADALLAAELQRFVDGAEG